MRIEELVPADNLDHRRALLPAILDIWNAEENLKYLSISLKPFRKSDATLWMKNHKQQGGHYLCAINPEGTICGIAVVLNVPKVSCELYGLAIRPDYKRIGVGRKLIESIIELAKDHMHETISLKVFADNSAMLRLALAYDFIPTRMDFNIRADGADIVELLKKL